MADISVPGFSDKYKTKDYIEALMQKERIPLNREKDNLDKYKEQQAAWRSVNQKMTTLRANSKSLYSFENPFNNKLATSSDEDAITAEAGREASYESIKVDVIKEATADRFLSQELEKNSQVPKGKYTFEVGEKVISFNWKGGKVTDFITALNKRSANTIKASLIGTSGNKQALLIESLKTGNDSNLIFKDDALSYALKNKIVEKSKKDLVEFGNDTEYFENPQIEETIPENDQEGMPLFKKKPVSIAEATDESGEAKPEDNRTIIPPRKGFTVPVDPSFLENTNNRIDFSYLAKEVDDITEELNNKRTTRPDFTNPGSVTFSEVTVKNEPDDTILPPIPETELTPIADAADFYVHNTDGTETKIDTNGENSSTDSVTGEKTISIAVRDFPDMDSIVVRNRNTGAEISMTAYTVYDEKKKLDYSPVNPVSTAGDATIKYNGITINRPTNKIDDVIPHVTLNVKQPTERTATIDITPDKDSAKTALIDFVGSYNQVIAEMTILSDNKPEVVDELDYLSKEEKEEYYGKLGMFQGDFSLTNGKSSLRNIVNSNYNWGDEATITMLSQIGISSRASGGGGYNASQLRGYLEIDEKKLDASIENNLDEIKNIFGYDKDGDLIIDSGIAYSMDKQLSSWVQSGGILATKNSGIDQRIKSSEKTIQKLEEQLDGKEAKLKQKYGQMEGTLNSLNAQSNTLNSFTNQNKQ
ncbi:MAG: flagellar filament capping protein FliD [Treponema sp.]|nr:flagellar filament capping protein FliD [Treponema sp.]